MIEVTVQIITQPINVAVSLDGRIGEYLTEINDTIDANTTVIINDPLS